MKFANIRIHRNGLNNLGDNMQLIAIENVYKNMGIKYDDVVRIDFYDLIPTVKDDMPNNSNEYTLTKKPQANHN